MDLKSMLNESSATSQPQAAPAAHPLKQSTRWPTELSVDGNLDSSAAYQALQLERPSQPPPLRASGSRSPSNGYDPAQSPSQHTLLSSFSTWSGGAGGGAPPGFGQNLAQTSSAPTLQPLSQVPGPHLDHDPRQSSVLSTFSSPSTFGVSRDSSMAPNGPSHSSSHQYSPHPPLTSLATPLGPPVTFPKSSLQTPQSTSVYGLNHTRSHSGGSFGSAHGYDPGEQSVSYHRQLTGRDSLARRFSDDKERKTSMSVSPKTIPHPSPLRPASGEKPQAPMTPPRLKGPAYPNTDATHLVSSVETGAQSALISPPSALKDHDDDSSLHSSRQQSPHIAKRLSTPSPKAMRSTGDSPAEARLQPALKRAASAVTEASSSCQPRRKRLKPAEIPIFARTARPKKPPLKLIKKESGQAVSNSPSAVESQTPLNGHVNGTLPVEGVSTAPVAAAALSGPDDWEPSIMGSTPYEELTRYICDMIYGTIGTAEPPTNDAVFEIEAKLGEIHNLEEGRRLRLPVMTETVFDKSQFGSSTRFESSMNVEQHQALNAYLNKLCAESQKPSRTPMFYDHPREIDTFYSLTAAGEATLPPSIRKYLNPKHRPRVRVTTCPGRAGESGSAPVVKRRIIKSRIADLDVHCPSLAFDYRISISIESPYDGPDEVLVKINDVGAAAGNSGGDREKDRVSYRHLAYQVDLTQVSYPNSNQREHELEIEISTETIRQELANLREGRPSRYEDVVRGFVDNVRILARRGTLHMKR